MFSLSSHSDKKNRTKCSNYQQFNGNSSFERDKPITNINMNFYSNKIQNNINIEKNINIDQDQKINEFEQMRQWQRQLQENK